MTIYAPNPVSVAPEQKIFDWSVRKIEEKKLDDEGEEYTDVYYHLVGTTPDGDGRVTSEIMDFDSEKMTITTKSGRKYILSGKTREFGVNAAYVLSIWEKRNGQTEEATEEFLQIWNKKEQ